MSTGQASFSDAHLLRSLVECSPDCIAVLSLDGRLQEINRAGLSVLRSSEKAQLVGRPWADLWPDHIYSEVSAAVFEAVETGSARIQSRLTQDEKPRLWDVHINRIDADDGAHLVCVCRDVTYLQDAQAALSGNLERYRVVEENTSDVIVRAGMDGALLYVSPSCRAYGYAPEELVGEPAGARVHPDDLQRFLANTAELLAGEVETLVDRAFRYRTKDGRYVWLEGNPRVIRDAQGRPIEIVNIFRDVTERRTLQLESERQAHLAAMARKLVGLGYWRLDVADGRLTWSPEVYEIFGVSAEDPLALQEAMSFVHPDDQAASEMRLKAALEDGAAWDAVITRLHRPDGEVRLVEGCGMPEFGPDGRVVAVFGTIIDVTERQRSASAAQEADAKLRDHAERMALAVRAGQVGIWEWDLVTNGLIWDKRMFSLYGLEPREGSTFALWSGALHPDDRDRATAEVERALVGGAGLDTEFRIIRGDGEVRHLRALGNVVRDERGAPRKMVGTNWDTTEVRQALISREASEARLRKLVANAHEAIVSINAAGVVTGWNAHATTLFGWESREALGRALTELIVPPAYREAHAAGMARFTATGEGKLIDQRIEVTAMRRSGEEFPIELSLSAVRGPDGWEMTALMHDISERRAKTELFENAFAHAVVGKALVSLEGGFLKVNPAFCRLVGYSEEEMLGLDFQTITHPEDLEADLSLLKELLGGERDNYRMEKRYRRADGTIVWVHLAVSLVHELDGRPKYFVAQVQDLTARREAEQRYRVLAENASDIVGLHDVDGTCLYMSPSSEKVLGYTPEEMVGRSAFDFVLEEDHAGLQSAQADLASSPPGTPVRHSMRMRRKDGSIIWVEVVGHLVENEGQVMVVAATRDISERVEAQLALEQQSRDLDAARIAAEAAAAAKTEFLANMSHEIRTPLTAVIGFNGLLAHRNDLSPEARHFVERVNKAGKALLELVNDILDFSKIEAGHFEIAPEVVSPAEQIRDALALFQAQCDAKGLDLTAHGLDELPASVSLDPARVRQILLNLVGNAVKFTDAGSVSVSASWNDGRLHCRVVDTGPGMSQEAQARLFQRFSQGDSTSTRKHGGTGLGLAICKGLSEAMGGKVTVHSVAGAGSTFSFEIEAPLATSAVDAALAWAPDTRLDGLRVLVVDDNPNNRELARTFLEAVGADVSEAESGEACLALTSTLPLDVILLDVHMPGLDGPETLARIRDEEGPNSDIPVLGFTALADLSRLEQSRFDGVVRKPVDPRDLIANISRAGLMLEPAVLARSA